MTSAVTHPDVRSEDRLEFVEWSVGELLRHAVRCVPERTALIVPATAEGKAERSWSYRELEMEAERAARALLRDFKPGDRVATWAAGSAEIVLLHLGAALAGIVLVTLNPANRVAEMEYLLSQGEVRGLFFDRSYRGTDKAAIIEALRPKIATLRTLVFMDAWSEFVATGVHMALPEVAAASPAMILFTSGTTGKPKGAVLAHRGIVNNARFTTACLQLPEGSVWLNLLPMFHVGGSVTLTLGSLANLGTQVLLPEFSADAMLDAIARYRVVMTMAVPTMLIAMMQSERFAATDLSSLDVIVTGGTVVAPELVREVCRRAGVEMMALFGQTEAGGCMCMTRRGDDLNRVTQSVGAPLPLSEVRIVVPATGSSAGIGDVGEIWVRTRCSMIEYFRMPGKSREALDDEGWLHTGDLGTLHADGYVQITGRLKDMIIRGGENIYPREIEDALAEHASIAQAAVYGISDPKWGEQVAAAVVFRPGSAADSESLVRFLEARIARHKVPKHWRFAASLPVNASGKIQKFVLRDEHEAAQVKT